MCGKLWGNWIYLIFLTIVQKWAYRHKWTINYAFQMRRFYMRCVSRRLTTTHNLIVHCISRESMNQVRQTHGIKHKSLDNCVHDDAREFVHISFRPTSSVTINTISYLPVHSQRNEWEMKKKPTNEQTIFAWLFNHLLFRFFVLIV